MLNTMTHNRNIKASRSAWLPLSISFIVLSLHMAFLFSPSLLCPNFSPISVD